MMSPTDKIDSHLESLWNLTGHLPGPAVRRLELSIRDLASYNWRRAQENRFIQLRSLLDSPVKCHHVPSL